MFWIVFLLFQTAGTQQVERGKALFSDTTNGCASCHALKGVGTAVGPDLKLMGSLSPAAIAMAIRSTATQYVQSVKLKAGETFPAMPGAKDEKVAQLWDLSKNPPVLRKIDRADIDSMTNNDKWKHPPAERKYTAEQMADLIAYLRYASTGSRQPVDPADVH